MAYFHIDRMQRYLQGLGFANVVHRSIPVNLHATAEDNSFYSPTTRALNFGDGGVDDAQDADVISHEYGHAIQDSQVPGFGVTTEGGTLGEGFGDYWQAAMSANQGNADIFNTCFAEWDTSAVSDDPLPCLRDVDHPWTVDQAVSECGGREIHCVGQAWANLLWTIRKQLGGATADRLVVQSQFSYAIESGFRDASLALLFADQQLNGGANRAFLQNLLVARGFLTLDELDDQPSGALPLVFPGDASGAAGVNTDERDVFAVQLPAGAGVVFQAHSAGNAFFTLALYGPGTTTIEGGTAVARTAAGSASPRIAFAPTTAGTYYLVVAADAGDGTYTVSALVDVDRDGAPNADRQLPVDLESDPGRLEQEREGRRLRPRVEDRDRPARGPRSHDHRDRRPAPARRQCDRLGRRSAEGSKGRRAHARQRRERQRARRRGRQRSGAGARPGAGARASWPIAATSARSARPSLRRSSRAGLRTLAARGAVAEWLGRGLQSPVQRFESARRLTTLLPVTRDIQLAKNETLFRNLNERLKELDDRLDTAAVGAPAIDREEFFCECGQLECMGRFEMNRAQYEAVRAHSERFVVLPGHEDEEIERVVDKQDRFFVVEKRPGGPAEVARENDPRV